MPSLNLHHESPASEPSGKRYWRSLEELMQTAAPPQWVQDRYPQHAAQWGSALSRREFLTLMGASLALAGMSGCAPLQPPVGRILPYIRKPEELIEGEPLYYATAMTRGGLATGLIVKSREGRPIKVEGNPDHPASLCATDVFAQAAVLEMYDPDRSRSALRDGKPCGRGESLAALRRALIDQKPRRGRGLRLLTETVTSPALSDQIAGDRSGALLHEYPEAKWLQYEPRQSAAAGDGARMALGRNVDTVYDLAAAEIIVALDADLFMLPGIDVRAMHDFTVRRRAAIAGRGAAGKPAMNRLYVAECMPSITGAKADHRLPLRPSEVATLAMRLAMELGFSPAAPPPPLPQAQQQWLEAVAKDLHRNPKASVVIAGPGQPAAVHAIVHWINDHLGSTGITVRHIEPVIARPSDQLADLRSLVDEMKAGQVETLLIFAANPIYSAPVDLDFAAVLEKVQVTAHLGLYVDETAARCKWHFPEAHFLETWSDARAFDGTVSIMQPLIAPLYDGRSPHELLAYLIDGIEMGGEEIVRRYWRTHWPEKIAAAEFDLHWDKALERGVIDKSSFTAIEGLAVRGDLAESIGNAVAKSSSAPAETALEINFQCDPTIDDGRFANNGWLQELPKPITRLTWDNAAFVSPALAKKLHLNTTFGDSGGEHGQAIVDRIEIQVDGHTVAAPVWILPGHADDAITVHLGYGRWRAGKVGTGVGFNAYSIRTAQSPWFAGGASAVKLAGTYELACVQMHHSMEGRDIVRDGEFTQFVANANFMRDETPSRQREYERELVPAPLPSEHEIFESTPPITDPRLHPLTLYPQGPKNPSPNRWGMSIDLTACVGCNACVMACQAENNSPVVGKVEVTRGREMHWIRIDRYYQGDVANPATSFQPVTCQQCENAPCELVCPVGATVHSADGLNDMVYNRCVGTRYCSNNCPYKVRRFNFFEFADFTTESYKAGRNPEVTVRSRGVMEKCTYCVQRIRAAQISAEVAGGTIRDGDVKTACQQACPAEAIIFGDLNDPDSEVSRRKKSPLNYGLLAELNTRPRTTYLGQLRNPNPDLK